ncbi:MAG: GNAT family N-acetyltransferase [Ilumatobacteraceae bacterium]
MSETSAATVRDNPDAHRYEVVVDDQVAGFAIYQRRGATTFFVHTEIDPAYEGQGLGSVLAAGALDAVRQQGSLIVPLCPFIRRYIDRHPEYGDLVDHDLLARIDRL